MIAYHVLGTQITMELTDEATVGTCCERLRVSDQECVRGALQCEHPLELGALLDNRGQLVEVLLHPMLDLDHGRCVGPHPRRSVMEVSQQTSESDDVGAPYTPVREPSGQSRTLVVAAHLDHVVHRLRFLLWSEPEPVANRNDRVHRNVQIGREPTVETHLLTT